MRYLVVLEKGQRRLVPTFPTFLAALRRRRRAKKPWRSSAKPSSFTSKGSSRMVNRFRHRHQQVRLSTCTPPNQRVEPSA